MEDGTDSLDHEGTWLLGHTERISFGELWEDEEDAYVDAVLHVRCKHFRQEDGGRARCLAHGYTGRTPRSRPKRGQARRLGGDRFRVVDRGRMKVRRLPFPKPSERAGRSRSRKALPVLESSADENPCATASCRTSDLKQGAACCRDLQVEIMCTEEEERLEALVFSRQSPYLCKVEREGEYSLGVEMISACDYLGGDDGVACQLHGRRRADGRPAKPELCSDWPEKKRGLHPGCVFGPKGRRRARQ